MDPSQLPEDMIILLEDLIEDELPEYFEIRQFNPLSVAKIDINASDRGREHALEMNPSKMPPLVVAHGCLLDGQHRLWKMQHDSLKRALYLDISEFIDPSSSVFKNNVIVDLGL